MAAKSCRHGHRAGGCQGQQDCSGHPQPTTSPAPSAGQVETSRYGGKGLGTGILQPELKTGAQQKELPNFSIPSHWQKQD